MKVPRTIHELLKDFNDLKIDDDFDKVIKENIWTKNFMEFLQRRDLESEITSLKFVIFTQPFQVKVDQGQKSGLREIYIETVTKFLSDESEDILNISNPERSEHMIRIAERLKRDPGSELTETEIGILIKARNDIDVIQDGLEPKFGKFIKTQNVSTMACLLSII